MDKLIDLINQGGTGEYDARQPQERGEAVAWEPSGKQIASACLSFRHDFGLLDDEPRRRVVWEAVEWLRAWQKEGFAHPPAADARVALSVWYGAMPESNGKTNWTAILVRDGDIASGYTFARSEYEDRVRYEADSMRFIIGEVAERPDLMAYDPDKHSGYVYPPTADDARVAELGRKLQEQRRISVELNEDCVDYCRRIAALESQLAASREREGRMREAMLPHIADLRRTAHEIRKSPLALEFESTAKEFDKAASELQAALAADKENTK